MKKTQSRSIKTLIKNSVFFLFDLYDALRKKISRIHSPVLGGALLIITVCFAVTYIFFFSELSLLAGSHTPSPPHVSRLLTQDTRPIASFDNWDIYKTEWYTFSYPPAWSVSVEKETSDTHTLLISPDKTHSEIFVRITIEFVATMSAKDHDILYHIEHSSSVDNAEEEEIIDAIRDSFKLLL